MRGSRGERWRSAPEPQPNSVEGPLTRRHRADTLSPRERARNVFPSPLGGRLKTRLLGRELASWRGAGRAESGARAGVGLVQPSVGLLRPGIGARLGRPGAGNFPFSGAGSPPSVGWLAQGETLRRWHPPAPITRVAKSSSDAPAVFAGDRPWRRRSYPRSIDSSSKSSACKLERHGNSCARRALGSREKFLSGKHA